VGKAVGNIVLQPISIKLTFRNDDYSYRVNISEVFSINRKRNK